MKKHFATLLTAAAFASTAHAQTFQKMYGVPGGANQQHLYGCLVDAEENIYASGTFRNLSVFPETTFRGTISRLDGDGTVQWYKSYMPAGFDDMEGYFITSIFRDDASAIYTFGYYLGITDEASGYYLQKIDASGGVIWAKHLQAAQPDMFAKAVFGNNSIYAAMGDRIARLDLSGNVLNSVAAEGLVVRDIVIDGNGNPAVTGEIYIDGALHLPVIRLSQDLGVNAGFAFAAADASILYADRIADASGDLMLLCNDGKVLRVAAGGSVQAAMQVLPVETTGSLFSITAYSGVVPLGGSTFAVQAKGFFADDINFRHSIVTYKMDAAGVPVSGFREAAQTPFGDNGQVTGEAFAAGSDADTYFAFGKVWNADGSNSLNFVQRGRFDQEGCEEEKELLFEELPPSAFTVAELSGALFGTAPVTANAATMVALDIPLDTDEKYCETALGIGEQQPDFVSVFPNPAGDQLYVGVAGYDGPVTVRDAAGRVAISTCMTAGAVDVSRLSRGVYVIELNIDGNPSTARFVKE